MAKPSFSICGYRRSEDSHKLLYSLCLPADPNDLPFKTLSGLLSDHFEPKKSYFAARYLFYQARKSNDESVAQWGARLRDLASRCKFGSELDIVIRDIFMVGMGPGKIQDRLLEEDASKSNVTLAKLMEVATNRETTANASKQWAAKGSPVTVNFTKPTQSKAKRSYQPTPQGRGEVNTYNASDKRKCQVCGRTNHTSSACKFKSYSCNTCGTVGHLAPMCKSKVKPNQGGRNKTQNKFMSEKVDTDSDSCVQLGDSFFSIKENSNDNVKINPFKITLTVEGKPITFEIDTGSLYSIISMKTFDSYFGTKTLVDNDIALTDYVGNKMTPAGKVQLAVTNNNESRSFWAYVIPNGGPPLIGRNDIVSLGIENIYSCNFNAETIDSILGKYKQLFEPGTRHF
ncbi:unnamed protein product [Macrosiphum euphorbiae]|uniref:CCHC-type domain-containing protein n=1 Tax=Macrosiphum euphorbiae TaxID=13131 RepID=A0AAV0XR89_9HEMI|nr:unnamed protein product [Macrosiphum euphorbiae]